MTKQKLILIIAMMSIASIGLISYQAYWINHTIKVSDDLFTQDVHAALNTVARQLETQEVIHSFRNILEIPQDDYLVVGQDSIKYISKNPQANLDKKVFIPEEVINALFRKQDTFNLASPDFGLNLESPSEEKGLLVDEDVKIEIKRTKSRIDSITEEGMNSHIRKVQEKTQMVTVVLNELISREHVPDQRVSEVQIDTLLRQALHDRGIFTMYNFGVFNANDKDFLLTNDGTDINELKSSEFKTRLFKADIISVPSYLQIYFPYKDTFLLSKIWVSLASSLVFLIVMMISFSYAIYAIIKQKKIDEVKNDFINNMTHEFKTPISTVSLACEALQDSDVNQSPKLVDRYLDIIRQENNRLATQVEKVLQMATLDKKDFTLKREPLEMNAIVQKAMQNIRLQVEKKGGTIQYFPKAVNDILLGDEVHMTNIVYNLLDNANKYSGNAPDITLITVNNNGSLEILVRDKGIGMSKEEQSKIFEKFYRVPTGNRHDVKGFGLGLAYVKTILDMMGGKISVQSTLGEGSTFTIHLPLESKEAV